VSRPRSADRHPDPPEATHAAIPRQHPSQARDDRSLVAAEAPSHDLPVRRAGDAEQEAREIGGLGVL
jgi:hypothetical protein